MIKSAMLVAVLSAAAMVAGPAGAADLHLYSPSTTVVRIPVAGKSQAQLQTEIKSAADAVCGALDAGCVSTAIDDANIQLRAIARSTGTAKVEVARAAPTTIRVAVNGKSPSQLKAEINEAAKTVCKATSDNKLDYSSCVSDAVRDAQSQLQYFARADQRQQLATN